MVDKPTKETTDKNIVPMEEKQRSVPTYRTFDRLFDMFRRDMDDMFFGPTLLRRSGIDPGWKRYTTMPPVDIEDTGKEIVITADMPGVTKENLKIDLDEHSVSLSAEQRQETKDEGKNYLFQERGYRSFSRSFEFQEPIDPKKSTAELKDGILTVRMTKVSPKEKVSLEVK